jgi:3'(2'), 5'-bisphosphate nucleotidase
MRRRVGPRLDAMVEAARAGGAVALEHYRRGVAVSLKPDRSPVTEADHAAEAAFLGVLRGSGDPHIALRQTRGRRGQAARGAAGSAGRASSPMDHDPPA